MALINTLRNKMGKVTLIVIGLAMFAFIIGDFQKLFMGNPNNIGEIAGETVDNTTFQSKVEEMKANFGGNANMETVRNAAWDALISEIGFGKEFDKLGLEVTSDELVDMVQGKNISPYIKQQFTNPETGVFDKNQVLAVLQNISSLPADQQAQWRNYENTLKQGRLRTKYDNLLMLSSYVTKDEAKAIYDEQSAIAEVKYLNIPFYSVADSLVADVTDSDLKSYLSAHSKEYQVEAGRSLSYVNFIIKPSGADTSAFNTEMSELKQSFKQSEGDSLYARINTEGAQFYQQYSIAQVPALLQNLPLGMETGGVYGPYYEGGMYKLYKVSEEVEDTIFAAKVRHILFKGASDSDEDKATAKADAQKVLNELRGGADFAEKAKEHGKDGTAARGGELGWGIENQSWVAAFGDPVFKATKTGLLDVVKSEFGYHIVDVQEIKTNKAYKIATIERELTASEQTRDSIYRAADLFAFESKTENAFIENAEKGGLEIQTATGIGQNATRINNLSEARSVVSWLYNEAALKEVSKVLDFGDNNVIAVLTGITEKGTASVEDVKDAITIKVKNKLKSDFIIAKLKGMEGTLDQIATKYGADATVNTSNDLKFNSTSLPAIGFAPEAVGKAFSLKAGSKSVPFSTDNGVVIIETINIIPSVEIADYTTYKDQKIQALKSKVSIGTNAAIKKFSDIEDLRHKFY